MPNNLSTQIKEKDLELEYDLCGIIQANTFQEFIDGLNKRVEEFPESIHLYEGLYSLANPLEMAEWGKSIIVCVLERIIFSIQSLFHGFILIHG